MQIKARLCTSRHKLPKIVAGRPFQISLKRKPLHFVAIIPDKVDGSRLLIQAACVLVFDAIAKRELHFSSLAR
jgi:hypothetical protein